MVSRINPDDSCPVRYMIREEAADAGEIKEPRQSPPKTLQ